MTASVIIPHLKNQATLAKALDSIRAAACGIDVEIIPVEDEFRRGPSWGRNRGLERAHGDVVFFVDADDEVRNGFFTEPIAALERTGADICLFSGDGEIKRSAREIAGLSTVRDTYLPAFFGISFDDVVRWNHGGSLLSRREPGSVCLAAFRREFLERNKIRFDEAMTFYEDAAFLANCVAFAEKVVTIPDNLYIYKPRPDGNLASGSGSRRHWEYKFLSKDFRERLDAATGGEIWRFCEASCVFSLLEMIRLWKSAGLDRRQAWGDIRRYFSDERVRKAVRDFPVSWRHPLVATVVTILKGLA